MTSAQAHDIWVESPPGLTVVAIEAGRVVGSAKMGRNYAVRGSHISTASFMVASDVVILNGEAGVAGAPAGAGLAPGALWVPKMHATWAYAPRRP